MKKSENMFANSNTSHELNCPASNIPFQQQISDSNLFRVNAELWIHDILLANRVLDSGVPNRFGCRIPVESTWNLQLFESLLTDYHDKDVIEWLKFGFPVSRIDGYPDPVPAGQEPLRC